MSSSSLQKVFIANFKPKPKDKTLRKIGIEMELPVVKKNGEAVDYKTIRKMFLWLEKKGWELSKDQGTGENVGAEKSVSEGQGRFGYSKDTIGTDVGFCTVETSLTPEDDLNALEKHWELIKDVLLEFLHKENCRLLGYGVQPLTQPNRNLVANKGRYRFFEQDSLNRFIDQCQGVDLHVFATSAANQCHIDIYKEEAIQAVNVFNGLAPLFTVLMANAPVWKGSIDPDWIDIREIYWDKSWSNRVEQTGIPESFHDFNDYIDRIGSFRPMMVKRNGEFVKILGCKTFREYLEKGEKNQGETVAGKIIQLSSEPEDLLFHNGFAWWDARLAPSFGTIEIRPCGQQPPGSSLCVGALTLGLLENLNEAEKVYQKHTVNEWRKLRFDALRHGFKATIDNKSVVPLVEQILKISEKGLKKRKLNEEKFLKPLWARLKKQKSPAEEIKKIFNPKDLTAFFKKVEFV